MHLCRRTQSSLGPFCLARASLSPDGFVRFQPKPGNRDAGLLALRFLLRRDLPLNQGLLDHPGQQNRDSSSDTLLEISPLRRQSYDSSEEQASIPHPLQGRSEPWFLARSGRTDTSTLLGRFLTSRYRLKKTRAFRGRHREFQVLTDYLNQSFVATPSDSAARQR